MEIISTGQARWGTQNTKVAACLLTYGYTLCREQPIIRLRDPDGKAKDGVSFWFHPDHPTGSFDAPSMRVEESCGHWESAWIKAEKWAALEQMKPRPHPWVYMRAGLDAWQHIAARTTEHPRDADGVFVTEDPVFAACLVSLNFRMFDKRGGAFAFPVAARSLLAPYSADATRHVIRWPKFALIHFERLIHAVRNPVTHKGDVPNYGFRVGDRIALIPEDAPPAIREPLIRMLYG